MWTALISELYTVLGLVRGRRTRSHSPDRSHTQMIRTVPIPTKVSRMGCAPAGDCCDECTGRLGAYRAGANVTEQGHRGLTQVVTLSPQGYVAMETLGHSTPQPTGNIPAQSARNVVLHRSLGDTQCDPDGNCYTNGVLTAAPLTTGSGCAAGDPTCSTSTSSSSTWLYMGAGLLGIALLEATSRRR